MQKSKYHWECNLTNNVGVNLGSHFGFENNATWQMRLIVKVHGGQAEVKNRSLFLHVFHGVSELEFKEIAIVVDLLALSDKLLDIRAKDVSLRLKRPNLQCLTLKGLAPGSQGARDWGLG